MSRTSHFLLTLVFGLGLALSGCSDDTGSGSGTDGVCTPSCGDSVCGDDGCGSVCGTCDTGDVCSALGACLAPEDCIDTCEGLSATCGSVCGASCGSCASDEICTGYACQAETTGGGGGGGGGFGLSTNPQMEVLWGTSTLGNGDYIEFGAGSAEVGVPYPVGSIRIINTGDGPLELREISVSADPEGLFVVEAASTALPTEGAPVTVLPQDSEEEGITTFTALINLVLDSEDTAPTGTITVRSNSTLNNATLMTFTLDAAGAEPQIQVTPATVEFGNVSEESTDTKPITILNTGTGDLVVTGFVLSGSEAFAFQLGATEWPVTAETESQGVEFDEPLIVPAGTASNASVRFTPLGAEPSEATLILFSNDPDAQSGTVVPISGNLTGPCISINPKKVDFGGKLIGVQATVEVEILSCGESPLTISGISIVDLEEGVPSSTDFGLDLAEFVDNTSGSAVPILGPNDAPIEIPVNGTKTFDVTFTPDMINELDPDTGAPIPDLGTIRIVSDAFASELDVEVKG
ncbi:MAG: choice-of-anchor D domain-containing protein, partial [Myxococcota bacterium]|nr:choice-of-anchor D domain-containing protein [Myxococcota bacterium]